MNSGRFFRFCLPILAAAHLLQPAFAVETNLSTSASPGEEFRGRGLYVHDPSTVVPCAGEYWLFSTGRGLVSRHSRDLVTWEPGPRVFSASPAWTTNLLPNFRGSFWAPDIIHLQNRYLLYYSVSQWGTNTSAIGLATNPTLDPSSPVYRWTDQGLVCQSRSGDNFNAIDPCVAQATDGSLWLAFGSFWSGIKLIQLDMTTGKRIAGDSPMYSLAYHQAIEAPCLWRHKDFYYLFVNWGECCRGTNSTYNIRIGRSATITGPYVDKRGVDLCHEGGSLFLETSGRFIGPGHAGVFSEGGTNWLSFHYYDGNHGGAATLAIRPLQWGADGWPAVESGAEEAANR